MGNPCVDGSHAVTGTPEVLAIRNSPLHDGLTVVGSINSEIHSERLFAFISTFPTTHVKYMPAIGELGPPLVLVNCFPAPKVTRNSCSSTFSRWREEGCTMTRLTGDQRSTGISALW